MNKIARMVIVSGALALGAFGQSAAPPAGESLHQAKYGRPSAMEEARRKAELANTAFRQQVPPAAAETSQDRLERHFRAKYGRETPVTYARLKAERESTAFRQAPIQEVPSPAGSLALKYKAKYGRAPGR